MGERSLTYSVTTSRMFYLDGSQFLDGLIVAMTYTLPWMTAWGVKFRAAVYISFTSLFGSGRV